MTPGARIQAAIDLLDRIDAGEAAEKALTGWGVARALPGRAIGLRCAITYFRRCAAIGRTRALAVLRLAADV